MIILENEKIDKYLIDRVFGGHISPRSKIIKYKRVENYIYAMAKNTQGWPYCVYAVSLASFATNAMMTYFDMEKTRKFEDKDRAEAYLISLELME